MRQPTSYPPEPVLRAAPAPLTIRERPAHPRNYSRVRRLPTQIRLIVLHCTDGHEGVTKDDDVAAMFAQGDLEPRRSCHYVVDANSVTRCVPDLLTAWHAKPKGNRVGIGIEVCGRAKQSRAEWLDALSLPTLQLAARLTADLCRMYKLPAQVVNPQGLRLERSGITTHAFISQAWKESNHTDPGVGFPLGKFVDAVAAALAEPRL